MAPLKEYDAAAYESTRRELMLAAMEDAKKGDGLGADPYLVEQALNTPDGIAFVLFLCAKKEDPNVKLEDIKQALEESDLSEVKKKLDDITVFSTDNEGDDPLPNSKRGKRSRQD